MRTGHAGTCPTAHPVAREPGSHRTAELSALRRGATPRLLVDFAALALQLGSQLLQRPRARCRAARAASRSNLCEQRHFECCTVGAFAEHALHGCNAAAVARGIRMSPRAPPCSERAPPRSGTPALAPAWAPVRAVSGASANGPLLLRNRRHRRRHEKGSL